MGRIREEVGHLDFIVHALAYAPREALEGMYADTKREDFRIALDVSAYSLVAVSRAALPLMKDRQAGIVTLTYLGSRTCRSELQRHGRGKGSPGSVGPVS